MFTSQSNNKTKKYGNQRTKIDQIKQNQGIGCVKQAQWHQANAKGIEIIII